MSQSSRSVSRGLTISAPTSSAEGRGVSEALQISALVPDMHVQRDGVSAASDEPASELEHPVDTVNLGPGTAASASVLEAILGDDSD